MDKECRAHVRSGQVRSGQTGGQPGQEERKRDRQHLTGRHTRKFKDQAAGSLQLDLTPLHVGQG